MASASPDKQASLYEAYANTDYSRVPLGWRCLDEQVLRGGGLAPGDLLMVVARSEVGKSYWLQNTIANIARDGTPILDVSLEMTVEQKFQRMACLEFGLDPKMFEQEIRHGNKQAYEYLDLYTARFPNYHVYKPGRTSGAGFDDFSRAAEKFEKETGEAPRVVAIDFLGLIRKDKFAGGEAQRIPGLAQDAERWADSLGVSLILLHQTGRANEGNPNKRNHGHVPLTMEDLMYGGEQNADYIIGLYRPDREPPPDKPKISQEYTDWDIRIARERNNMYVQVLKNRHGPRTVEAQYPGFRFKQEWPTGRMVETWHIEEEASEDDDD